MNVSVFVRLDVGMDVGMDECIWRFENALLSEPSTIVLKYFGVNSLPCLSFQLVDFLHKVRTEKNAFKLIYIFV